MLVPGGLNAMGLSGSGSLGPLSYDAVDFDGTNDYYSRIADLVGNADGTQGILSFWFRADGGDGTLMRFLTNTGNFLDVQKNSSNQIKIVLFGASPFPTFSIQSSATITAGATWHHILASWDTNFSAGNKLGKLVIDGVTDAATLGDADIAFVIDYTQAAWAVSAAVLTTAKFNGCLSEFYFNNSAYMDVTTAPNIAKFYNAGKPVNLGPTGAVPTGALPIVYLHVAAAGSAAAFATNLGYGGAFTVNGSPVLCSSKP